MGNWDFVGNRGQSMAHNRLTAICHKGKPYFAAQFLGDKFPTFDFLVELVGGGDRRPYFFVQVKTTRAGMTTTAFPRLRVGVKKSDVRKMVKFQAPTYVIGIDEPKGEAYIVAVYGKMSNGFSSMSTQHPLNPATLQLLWKEVKEYWNRRDMRRRESRFVN
jgi:hypothetical protein